MAVPTWMAPFVSPTLTLHIQNYVVITYSELLSKQSHCKLSHGKKAWCSGESTRLPPMLPGFDFRTWRHMWVEFVVGSLLCSERFFSRYSRFPLSLKNQHFQIPMRSLNARAFLNEFLWTPWCSVGKHITLFLLHGQPLDHQSPGFIQRSVISVVYWSVSNSVLGWLTDLWLVHSWSAVRLNVVFQLGT